MIKQVFILIGILLGIDVYAQDVKLYDLKTNRDIYSPKSKMKANEDRYIYELDTVDLPFIDDFSRDRFKKFDAIPTDPNVTSVTVYALYDALGVIPEPDTVKFMADTTYTITRDSIGNNLIIDSVANPTLLYREWNRLGQQPITDTVVEVWPAYNIVITKWDSISTQVDLTPDYVQDSITVHTVAATDTNSLWIDNYVYLNSRYGTDPMSIGIATFDGINENGMPYDFEDEYSYGIADYLTSKPIYLFSDPAGGNYTASNNIYFSFFYQSTGLGNEPEPEDSLIVEFYNVAFQDWESVWAIPGEVSADTFKFASIKITEDKYLKDGFQFRFKNYAALSGNLDHWHIDYVYLSKNRSDVVNLKSMDNAIKEVPESLINNFEAMPWHHFKTAPMSYMKNQITLAVQNNNHVGVNMSQTDHQIWVDYKGQNQDVIVYPSLESLNEFETVTIPYDFNLILGNPYVFDTSVNDTCATFDITYTTGIDGTNLIYENDTLVKQQVFTNYYAYDDGTAEKAIGIEGPAVKMACKFTIPLADTLKTILMHFTPSVIDATDGQFFLTIWADNGGEPGAEIYKDFGLSKPIYSNERNGFVEYQLETPTLVSGTFYVGWSQSSRESLNLGFDLNTNSQNKVFYDVSGSWSSLPFPGSLMLRPVFASLKDLQFVSIPEVKQGIEFKMYPNPTREQLNIVFDNTFDVSFQLRDISGKQIKYMENFSSSTINVSDLSEGMYFIILTDKATGNYTSRKVIIQK